MKWLLGTFITRNTSYTEVVKKYLLTSCENVNISDRLRVVEIDNYNSWLRNVAEKPNVILQLLNTLEKDDALVFVDSDASFERFPMLFDELLANTKIDIAFHRLDWNRHYGHSNNPPTKELLSGTLFLRNNAQVKKLCEEWYEKSKSALVWEQRVLDSILSKHNLTQYELPFSYCYIPLLPCGTETHDLCQAVIKHENISRKLKRNLNNAI